jgi:hypothetical protein
MDELGFKCVPHPHFNLDIAPSDFFLFGWLKGELSSRQVSEFNGIFEMVDEILSTLTSDTIARVFGN